VNIHFAVIFAEEVKRAFVELFAQKDKAIKAGQAHTKRPGLA
jgi:hypothetical protein